MQESDDSFTTKMSARNNDHSDADEESESELINREDELMQSMQQEDEADGGGTNRDGEAASKNSDGECEGNDNAKDDDDDERESFLHRSSDAHGDDKISPNNIFSQHNVSASLKALDIKSVIANTDNSGYAYFFVSEATGPTMPAAAMQQINMLLCVIQGTHTRAHVVETEFLKPQFSSDGVLQGLTEITRVYRNPYTDEPENYPDVIRQRTDHMDFDTVVDFREGAEQDEQDRRTPIEVATIRVAICNASGTLHGKVVHRTFFLVILQTKKNYDFCGNLIALLQGSGGKGGTVWGGGGGAASSAATKAPRVSKKNQTAGYTSDVNPKIHQLIYEVMLHQYHISPNLRAFLNVENAVDCDPIKRFAGNISPDSIESVCSVHEIFRYILFLFQGLTALFVTTRSSML